MLYKFVGVIQVRDGILLAPSAAATWLHCHVTTCAGGVEDLIICRCAQEEVNERTEPRKSVSATQVPKLRV